MKLIFAYCLLLIAHCLQAQEIQLAYEKQKVLLGEQIHVKAITQIAKGQNADFFSIDTIPHFEILERPKIDSSIVGDKLQLMQTLLITSFDSGRWNVPTVIINNQPTTNIAIDVVYTSPWDPRQPYHDIKGIIPVKSPGKSTWWWYLIGLAVLVALFLLFFPEDKKEKTIELDRNAYKKAMQQLEQLQKDNTASTNTKEYYTTLINIFRGYLKCAKGIQSFTKTTDDLSIQLQALKLPEYNQLVQTLRLSDLAKFAQYKPDGQMNQDSFNIIKQSITTIEHQNAV